MMSATTDEAVGICPAPGPEYHVWPTASPVSAIMLCAPLTCASGRPWRISVGCDVHFQLAVREPRDRQQLDGVAQFVRVHQIGRLDGVDPLHRELSGQHARADTPAA